MQELIVDSFAGGGGASEGIRAAIGRDPDIAINHDRLALAMHRVNHPGTHHIAEDVWHVDPVSMCAGRSIGLLWMSPDCKHFSKAKGGKPREFYHMMDTHCPGLTRRADIYARCRRPGWDSYGDELDKFPMEYPVEENA